MSYRYAVTGDLRRGATVICACGREVGPGGACPVCDDRYRLMVRLFLGPPPPTQPELTQPAPRRRRRRGRP